MYVHTSINVLSKPVLLRNSSLMQNSGAVTVEVGVEVIVNSPSVCLPLLVYAFTTTLEQVQFSGKPTALLLQ
jgi:hypothetical protein